MSQEITSPRITPKEAAAILHIGRSTLWRRVKERPDFPQRIRDGALVFFSRDEVMRYAMGTTSTATENNG